MVRARCPDCDALVEITPTGARQHPTRGSSTWWRVVMHALAGAICEGSGKLV